MKRIYHILTHTLEPLFPELKANIKKVSEINHTVNKYIKNLIKEDKKKEFEHILVLISASVKNKMILRHRDNYTIIILKTFSLKFPIEFSLELIKFVKRIPKESIIHIHGTSSFVFDSITPFIKNKNTIGEYWGGHFTWKAFPLSFLKYDLIYPISLRFLKKIFVQNKFRLRYYNNKYFIKKQKLVYIPNAIETSFFEVKNKKTKKQKNKKTNILFVGRLERAKGLLELIYVFQKLNKRYDIRLHIVGTGKLRTFVKKKEKENKNIKYHGFLKTNQLKKIYSISDIFVLPTHFDSFPGVLLEAMSFKLPIISTKVEGPLTCVENNRTGFLIKKKSKKELLDTLELLVIDKKLRKKFGINGKQKLNKEFTWSKVSKKIFYEYHEFFEK